MSDDQNTTQNQDSTENSITPSPQEPTEQTPEITPVSTSLNMPPEAPERPINSESAIPVNNDNSPKNEPEATRPESGEALEMPQNQASSEPQTAQIPASEPLNEQAKPVSVESKSSFARELLIKARNAIQFRKRKKLDKIMLLFLHHSKITNDEVEKYLHVSDATATRYLSILEKEGKIKQSGKTGKGVSYSRI